MNLQQADKKTLNMRKQQQQQQKPGTTQTPGSVCEIHTESQSLGGGSDLTPVVT